MAEIMKTRVGKGLSDYKVRQEIDTFFYLYDAFGGTASEEEEMEMWEQSFSPSPHRKPERVKRAIFDKLGSGDNGRIDFLMEGID